MSILKQLSPEKKFKLIGEIASLMISSDLHITYKLKDIRDIFMPAVDANQFRIYHSIAHGEHSNNSTNPSHNKEGFPVGFICWAFLSDDVDKLYAEGKYKLKPQDWNSGQNGWIIELIAPFGHGKQIISELRRKIFPNKTGKALVFSKDRKELKVINIRGERVN